MTLTLGPGPLAGRSPADTNYEIDGPKHRLFFEDYPRRMRALVSDHVVLETTRGKLLHETGILPRLYVPIDDIDSDVLEASEHTTHCPFKGDASYWTVKVSGRRIEDALWHYPEPLEPASWLKGYACLYDEAADLWLQEDEPVRGHLRDPYHRVDVLATSRQVMVKAGGEVVAESDRPKLLFETGLAPRVYLLRSDIRPGILERSEKTTVCPYKGNATYWHVKTAGSVVEDAAWSYEAPRPEALAAADHLCFDGEGIEVEVS